MRPGRVVMLSLLVAVAGAPAAVAEPTPKPKPRPAACKPALRDPAGDTVFGPAGNAFQALDIVGGRLARGKTELGGVLVLAGDVATDDAAAPLGYRWVLGWAVNGVDHRFALVTSPTGAPTAEFSVNGIPLPVVAAVEGRTITWRVKRSDLPPPTNPDRPAVTALAAATSVAGVTADEASDGGKFPGRCKR